MLFGPLVERPSNPATVLEVQVEGTPYYVIYFRPELSGDQAEQIAGFVKERVSAGVVMR